MRRRHLVAVAAALSGLALAGCAPGAWVASSNESDWAPGASMPGRRSYAATTQLGAHVYVAGGMVGETGRALASFVRYDPARDRWQVLRPLPEPTRAAAAAAIGRRIYVVGGTSGDGNTTATWMYDVDTGSWSPRAPAPAPRFNHALVRAGDRLLLLGGYDRGRERREVYAYDPRRDRWSPAGRLPRPVHAFGAVAYRGRVWVIGGRRGEQILREVWIRERQGTWRQGRDLPSAMELLGATVAGDDVHAVWESVHLRYDGHDGRWIDAPPLRVTRHALGLFALGHTLVAVGGCTTALRDTQAVERLDLSPS